MKSTNTRWLDHFSPKNILNNYFWLITFTSFLNVLIGVGWLSTLVLPLVIYILLCKSKKNTQLTIFDFLWYLIFIWMLSTWLYNDYPNKGLLIARCLISQIAYMITYWLSRKSSYNIVSTIIEKAYWPLLLTSVVGIFCFFFKPGWYMNLIQIQIASKNHIVTEAEILELSRLRSIFDSPYTLSYFIAIVLIYDFYLIVNRMINTKISFISVFVLIIALLLTMQRGPVISAIIGFVVAIIYGLLYLKYSRPILMLGIFTIIVTIGTPIFISSMNKSSANYFTKKVLSVTSNSNNYATERLYLEKNDLNLTFDFWGDGVGRHDLFADRYNKGTSIRDGEYMKMMKEQGYVGMSLFLLMTMLALVKCVKNFKYLSFEFCIVVMLLLCMIGANPLSTGDKHSIIFWMVFGQISKFRNGNKIISYYRNL